MVSHDHSSQEYEVILGSGPSSDEEGADKKIDTIKIHGVDKTVSMDTLTYYFESKRRSGGGPIISIRRDDGDEDVVFITFESSEGEKNMAYVVKMYSICFQYKIYFHEMYIYALLIC